MFGIFAFGKVLYGFAKKEKDIQTVVAYLPTEDEIFLKVPKRRIFKHSDGSTSIITDLRLVYDKLCGQDIIIMESIFSDYYIINPRYEEEYCNNILLNKEAIFKYDVETRIKNAIERGLLAIQNKNYFEACRIRIACELYLGGTPVEECIKIKKDYLRSYLQQVEDGILIPDIDELKDDYYIFLEKASNIPSNHENSKYFKDMLKRVMLNANRDNKAIYNTFKDTLTKNELIAFEIITKAINYNEGMINISQLTADSDISRPVFKNTLQKMEKYYIANVKNRGVKGTYIKILNKQGVV